MLYRDYFIILFVFVLFGILYYLRQRQQNLIFPPPSQSPLTPVITYNSRLVRIILPTGGSGLIQDAKVYQTLIPNSYIIQVDRNSPDTHPDMAVEVDVNLYLESVHGGLCFFPAKERWLMINQEYFFPHYAEIVDVIITKSKYAEALLTEYVKKLGIATRVVYLGHTSLPYSINPDKDWDLLVHFAGKSQQKGTKQLIRLWQKNNGFRHLAPRSRLVVTCRDLCRIKISDELGHLEQRDDYWEDPKTGLVVYKYIHDEELEKLRSRAGVFICPSLVEGYGHYINEGTANASVVITSDFPPMNELVPRSEFLIPPLLTLSSWEIMEPFGFIEPYIIGKHLPTSEACIPDFNQLGVILTKYFNLSNDEKQEIGEINYRHYVERQEEFRSLLTSFLDERHLVFLI